MEINIAIRNATPEELQRLFIGMQMTDAILGKSSRKGMPGNLNSKAWSLDEKNTIAGC
jgi:hypothetical protein